MDTDIDPRDLLKHQDTDAQKWAKAFMSTLKNNPDIEIDESLMLSWFAAAIMCKHDELHNKKITPLEKELLQYKNSYRFITED